MEHKTKNSPLVVGAIVAVLALVIYVLANKFFGTSLTKTINNDKIETKTALTDFDSLGILDTSTRNKVSLSELPVLRKTDKRNELERLPSFNNIEKPMRLAIKRIEKNLDLAYTYKPEDATRIALLISTEKMIDSILAKGDNAFLHASKGDLYMLMGLNQKATIEYGLALQTLGNISAIEQNYAGACYNVAVERMNENDTDLAIAYMERFYNIVPEDENGTALLLSWYKKRAVGLLRKNENALGLAILKKALLIAPNDHIVHFNTAIAYYRLLKLDKAIEHFKTCLTLNANDNYSKNYLFTIYSQRGDLLNAAKYQTEATDITIPIK